MPCSLAAWHDHRVPSRETVNTDTPTRTGRHDGLAYALWLPKDSATPKAGIVILHGAGSRKENHYDYARAAVAAGFAAIAFDQRGHGASDGPMDDRAIDDVVGIAGLLRTSIAADGAAIALRGSSMGGYLAIVATAPAQAEATVAICPASSEALRRGLLGGQFDFDADVPSLTRLLEGGDLDAAVGSLTTPLLLLHAELDEQVPVQHSRDLALRMRAGGSRLIVVEGGHHRSIQHDEALQDVSLEFVAQALACSCLG
jgi:alpha-beta hydrolase superfamily lysophospholipase